MRDTNLNSEVNEKCPIVLVLQHEKCECKVCQITGRRLTPKTRISKSMMMQKIKKKKNQKKNSDSKYTENAQKAY
jgi:hypothetical protein